jgi:glycerophosphoryl diester phosphodiesterase
VSNAIIKQQGDQPIVADNIWQIKAGAGTFLLGLLTGSLAAAVVGRSRRSTADISRPAAPRDWPVPFIHRGGAAVVPEDTIQGFHEGLKYGEGVIECDVHATLDGELVVMHDPRVDRTTNGTGLVSQLTYAEVEQLDAGYRFSTDGKKTFPWRGKGVKIPTLAQVYQEFPESPVNIEIKKTPRSDIEQLVATAIDAAGAQGRTLVVSQSWTTMRRFRQASKNQVATASSTFELLMYWLLSLVHLTWLLDPPFQALQPPEKYRGLRVVSPGFIRAAHRQGLRVDVWTIDAEADMRRLLGWGVDGIMTDRPDVLAQVLHGPGANAPRS